MLQFIRSSIFDDWLRRLSDPKAKARILARLRAAQHGHFGDCEPVGHGISEMRIHIGAGYRIYYKRVGETVYLLLVGGDKGSQRRDIDRARDIAKEWTEQLQ